MVLLSSLSTLKAARRRPKELEFSLLSSSGQESPVLRKVFQGDQTFKDRELMSHQGPHPLKGCRRKGAGVLSQEPSFLVLSMVYKSHLTLLGL